MPERQFTRIRSVAAALCAALVLALAPAALPGLEARPLTSLTGYLEVLHQDTFGPGASRHVLVLHWAGQRIPVTLDGVDARTEPGFSSGRASVTGRFVGGRFVASSVRPLEMASPSASTRTRPPSGGNGGGGGGGSSGSYLGKRDTLVILFNFASDPSNTPISVDGARTSVFTDPNSTAAYYADSSFGKMSLGGLNDGTASDKDAAPGDVTGWYTITDSDATCQYDAWGTSARAAATAAGWNLTGYEHIVHVFPRTSSCNWRGLGQLGGSYTWINGVEPALDMDFNGIVAHEIGHNLTLYHSRAYDCTSGGVRVAFSNSCTVQEYGDPFDSMGRAYRLRQGFNKAHLGWLDPSSIANAQSGSTYVLYPVETALPGQLQLLRIPRGRDYLYLEVRQPHGLFDTFAPNDPVVNGVTLRIADDFTAAGPTYLIDTTPTTPTFLDAPLLPGQGFVDPVKRVYVETLAVNGDGSVTVRVRTSYLGSAPSVAAGPGHALVVGVAHTHDGATVTDIDENLMSYTWSFASCPSACPPLAGASGSLAGGSAAVPGPTFTPSASGGYQLTVKVWDTAGVTGTASVQETAA